MMNNLSDITQGEIVQKQSLSTVALVTSINLYFLVSIFLPALVGYLIIFLLSMDIVYILFNKKTRLLVNSNSIIGFAVFFVLLIGSFYNSNFIASLRFVFNFGLFYLNYLLLLDNNKWSNIWYKQIKFISLFFLVGSIIQLLSPTTLNNINAIHLNSEYYMQSKWFVDREILVGFTSQSGINGYLLAITLLIKFSDFLSETNKTKNFFNSILILFILYMTLLTGKRGFIIYVVLIVLYLLYISEKNIFKSFLPAILFMSVFIVIIVNTEAGSLLIERTIAQDDISTGRFPMYQIMWKDFLEKPLTGAGTFSTIDIFSAGHGHNIYLQVLRENGLIGFLIFIIFIVSNFINSHKSLKFVNLKSENGRVVTLSISLQLLFLLWGVTGNTLYNTFSLIMYFVAIAITNKNINRKQIKFKKEKK